MILATRMYPPPCPCKPTTRKHSHMTCMHPPPHMTCMYPPPHMTCMYPLPRVTCIYPPQHMTCKYPHAIGEAYIAQQTTAQCGHAVHEDVDTYVRHVHVI